MRRQLKRGDAHFLVRVLIALAILLVAMWVIRQIGPTVTTHTGCKEMGGICKERCGVNDEEKAALVGCKNPTPHCCVQPEIQGERDQRCMDDSEDGYKESGMPCEEGDNLELCYNGYCISRCKYCSIMGKDDSHCEVSAGQNVPETFAGFSCRSFTSAADCIKLNQGEDGVSCVRGFCPETTLFCANRNGAGAADGELRIKYFDEPVYIRSKQQTLDKFSLITGESLPLEISFTGEEKTCSLTIFDSENMKTYLREQLPEGTAGPERIYRTFFDCGEGKEKFVSGQDNPFYVADQSHVNLNLMIRVDVYNRKFTAGEDVDKLNLNALVLRRALIPLDVKMPSQQELQRRQPLIDVHAVSAASQSCIIRCTNALGEDCDMYYTITSADIKCEDLDWAGVVPHIPVETWKALNISNGKLCLRATIRRNPTYETIMEPRERCSNIYYTNTPLSSETCHWNSCAIIPNSEQCHSTVANGCSFMCVWDNVLNECHLCGDPELLCRNIRREAACEAAEGQCGMPCEWVNRIWPFRDGCRARRG